MRASLLILAVSSLLIAAAAADGQVRPVYPGVPQASGRVTPPRYRDRGEPARRDTRQRPGRRPDRPGIWHPGDWRHGHGHHGHGHQGHGHHGHGHHGHEHDHWGRIPWWYWYHRYPYFSPHRYPPHWHHRSQRSRPNVRSASYEMENSYKGTDCGNHEWPPEMSPPIPTPYPNGTDSYAGDPSGYGTDPYATDPYAYGGEPSADLESQHVCSPYYESEPVQYAYTPADIPQRAAVVRPERATPASLILPSHVRMPLY